MRFYEVHARSVLNRVPEINDAPHQVEPLLERAHAAGATSIGGIALHLRGEVRDVFMQWLRAQRPDLVPRYQELYRRGAYAPRQERERLSRMVRSGGSARGVRRPPGSSNAEEDTLDMTGHPVSTHRQESLF
jgi:DNA repair photolyase